MLHLEDVKGHFANQVFERMKEESFGMEGCYSDSNIDVYRLYIHLIKNNIPIDETDQY